MKKIGKTQEKLEYYDVYNCENILFQQVQEPARVLIGLSQHGLSGLHQNIVRSQIGYFLGHICAN